MLRLGVWDSGLEEHFDLSRATRIMMLFPLSPEPRAPELPSLSEPRASSLGVLRAEPRRVGESTHASGQAVERHRVRRA